MPPLSCVVLFYATSDPAPYHTPRQKHVTMTADFSVIWQRKTTSLFKSMTSKVGRRLSSWLNVRCKWPRHKARRIH